MLDSDDVCMVGGDCVCNRSGKRVTLGEIAAAAYRGLKIPPGSEPGLVATRYSNRRTSHIHSAPTSPSRRWIRTPEPWRSPATSLWTTAVRSLTR